MVEFRQGSWRSLCRRLAEAMTVLRQRVPAQAVRSPLKREEWREAHHAPINPRAEKEFKTTCCSLWRLARAALENMPAAKDDAAC